MEDAVHNSLIIELISFNNKHEYDINDLIKACLDLINSLQFQTNIRLIKLITPLYFYNLFKPIRQYQCINKCNTHCEILISLDIVNEGDYFNFLYNSSIDIVDLFLNYNIELNPKVDCITNKINLKDDTPHYIKLIHYEGKDIPLMYYKYSCELNPRVVK